MLGVLNPTAVAVRARGRERGVGRAHTSPSAAPRQPGHAPGRPSRRRAVLYQDEALRSGDGWERAAQAGRGLRPARPRTRKLGRSAAGGRSPLSASLSRRGM